MRFGLDVPTTGAYADARALAQLAADAEAAGWDGFFIWDVLDGLDPWIALTAIALKTTRINIGPMVLPLARHHPWLVAKRLAELDRLSGGRVICTVGLGYRPEDFAAFGLDSDPLARARQLDEALLILQGLWSSEPFSFAGVHYSLHDVTIPLRPTQTPRVPLWVAGGWPRRGPFRRAARWDGVCFKSVHSDTREWLTLDEFRAGLAYTRSQREPATPLEVIMSGDTSGDRHAAVAKVREFEAAGATWWVEEGLGWEMDAFIEHVRTGPQQA
jgi:alkanesulfonate monooxygenase SsuD/methylene tetrahydromethanopterin reductase-like flavin-dependent oxidoreductase (luciferase family)